MLGVSLHPASPAGRAWGPGAFPSLPQTGDPGSGPTGSPGCTSGSEMGHRGSTWQHGQPRAHQEPCRRVPGGNPCSLPPLVLPSEMAGGTQQPGSEERRGAQQVPEEWLKKRQGGRAESSGRCVLGYLPPSLPREPGPAQCSGQARPESSGDGLISVLPTPPRRVTPASQPGTRLRTAQGHIYLGHQGILLLLQGPEAAPAETQLSQQPLQLADVHRAICVHTGSR